MSRGVAGRRAPAEGVNGRRGENLAVKCMDPLPGGRG